jgi:YVTN family beta-propeller protein
MGNAKYIGRVGALAIALGIGAAVAGAPGVAAADTSAESSSAPDSSSAQASPSTSKEDSKPTASVDTSGDAQTAGDADASSDTDDDDASATSSVSEPNDEETAAPTDGDIPVTPEDPEPDAGEPAEAESTTDPVPNTPDEPKVPENASPQPVTETRTLTDPSDNDGPTAARRVAVDPAKAAESDPIVAMARGTGTAHPAATAVALTPVISTAAAVSAAAPVAVVDTAAPAAQVAQVGPFGAVSVLLGWLGLGPSMSTAPATPAAQPLLWGLLAWARREIQRTFFNQTPTINYNPVETTHIVDGRVVTALTGDLGAVDADGDPMTFTVTDAPEKGSVVVNPDGTFTYTPSREFAAVGGTDVFVVKAADVGFHLHGLDFLFKRDFGRTTETAVEVVVDAQCPAGCQINPVKVIDTIEVGNGPDGVAFSQDGSRAYVTNALDDTVSIIHVATGNVVGTIAVGDHPRDVAFNPEANRAYVTNLLPGTVSVINTLNNTVIATIPVGESAERLVVSPGGTRVYVLASQEFGSAMVTIDATTNTVLSKAMLNGTGQGIALHPNGVRVFVATQIDWLDVVEILNNNVTHFDTNDGWMRDVGFSPSGTRVYITNGESGTVSVRNANTYALIDTINVGENPRGLAVSPDGTRVYVVNEADGTVSVISTATNNVIKTVDVGFLPHSIAISPDGTRAYVTNGGSDSVSVLQLV